MPDWKIEYTDIRDFSLPQRDNTVLTQKRVMAYIGKFGPFVEYFPAADFNMATVGNRFEALKREIEGMHR